jgi:hypothetical protein
MLERRLAEVLELPEVKARRARPWETPLAEILIGIDPI